MEQKHRDPGYYWVKREKQWFIAEWRMHGSESDNLNCWLLNGIEAVFWDSSFTAINETRIPSPDEVVVIADEKCEMTPEMWEKLAERVKNKAQ